MRRLLAAGVDGILTDRPERARAIIGRSERDAGRAATRTVPAATGAVADGGIATRVVAAVAQARMAATSPA